MQQNHNVTINSTPIYIDQLSSNKICFNQYGSGSYSKAHFLDCGGWQLFKLVGHVLGEPGNGAEMSGNAKFEEIQRVSPTSIS